MPGCKGTAALLPEKCKLSKLEGQCEDKTLQHSYRSICGAVMQFAVKTRQECLGAAVYLAKFMSNPGEEHLNAAKYFLRYLKQTKSWKKVHDCSGDFQKSAYIVVDASLGLPSISGGSF